MNYEDYKGLLIRIANNFCNKPQDFDDMMGICNEAYCKAARNYQPEKGKFSTLLYNYATRALIDENRKRKVRYNNDITLNQLELVIMNKEDNYYEFTKEIFVDEKENTERRLDLKIQLENISQEAKEVVSMILSSPYELFEGTKSLSPKYLRGEVIRMLRQRKWKWQAIYQSIREIKNALQNFR